VKRLLLTVESVGPEGPLSEAVLANLLRKAGWRLVDVRAEPVELFFFGWRRCGGAWTALAAGASKHAVRQAVRGVEGVKILPAGVTP
jgi:hypothetical protein